MARIKYSALVSSISGSVGNATFQNSRAGHILRSKPLPPKSQTPGQMACRAKMSSLQASWQALTTVTRLKWVFFVAFSSQHIRRDNNILISGYNLFLQYQFARLLYNLPLLVSWTYNPLLVYPKIISLKISGSVYYFNFDSYVDANSYFFVLKLGKPQSSAKKYDKAGTLFIPVSFRGDFIYYLNDIYPALFGKDLQADDCVSYSLYWFSIVNPILTGYQTGVLTVQSV